MTSERSADFWIRRLELRAHPEGGYYREIYRSTETIDVPSLPARYRGNRAWGTSIYFLLKSSEPSNFHRLLTDEIWHFYAGGSLTLHTLTSDGTYGTNRLGPDFDEGERFQLVIPAGTWFGANVNPTGTFALIGCTLAPGFDFADFELGRREDLATRFPAHREIIEKLTPAAG
ncbi:MAG: cupin domain-containing protein [Candidatus Firestonebacteria bacterium]|nr:cupin domain-containing protein [Candidatus Firestonebacteria bacterium]